MKNRLTFASFVFTATLAAMLGAWGPCCMAAGLPEKNVLIVLPYSHEFPATRQLIEGIKEGFEKQDRYKINYLFEFLDIHLIKADAAYLSSVSAFFKEKYSRRKPDIVVTGAILSEFMMSHGDAMFPDTPILVAWRGNAELPDGLREHCYVVSASIKYTEGLDLIRQVSPDVKKILVVIGASAEEKQAAGQMAQAAERFHGRPEVVFLNGFTLQGMLEQVRSAGPGDVVLYAGWVKDVAGEAAVPRQVAEQVCRESPVPVYATEYQFLGSGVVGGDLFSFKLFGLANADKALAVLEGQAKLGLADTVPVSEPVFDWRALKRFGINEKHLPPGSRIEFRAASAWDMYKGYILSGLILMILESSLIIALMVNRTRRRKVEAELIHVNASLEKIVLMRTRELRTANEDLTQAKSRLEEANRQLDMNSRLDSLTGLFNRRHMDEIMEHEFARFARGGDPFSLVLCDIDFFKNVNDRYGHDAGDFLLKQVAGEISRAIRPYDTLSRWGGEEFLLFLPRTDLEVAARLAERIRGLIGAGTYGYEGTGLRCTVTFGVSSIKSGDLVSDVIKRADLALYQGKRAGRDRVVSG